VADTVTTFPSPGVTVHHLDIDATNDFIFLLRRSAIFLVQNCARFGRHFVEYRRVYLSPQRHFSILQRTMLNDETGLLRLEHGGETVVGLACLQNLWRIAGGANRFQTRVRLG